MKILVVHQGRRDDYQIAQAFVEAGHQVTLVTTGYANAVVRQLARMIPFKGLRKLAARSVASLDRNSVIHSLLWQELVAKVAEAFVGEATAQEWLTSCLARRALRVNGAEAFDVCLCYSYHAFETFAALKGRSRVKLVLFQCHPHPKLVRATLLALSDRGLLPKRLREKEFSYSPSYLAMLMAESHLSDLTLCASSYTRQSLLFDGCPPSGIRVVPYGVQQTNVNFRRGSGPKAELKLLFVGQFSYRKGLTMIGKILDRTERPLHITFVGRGYRELDPNELSRNPLVTISVKWDVDWPVVEAEYRAADIFVFPTFVEGFAQVVVEAMSFGCVPLVSRNCCGPDVIDNGRSGFVLDCEDLDGYMDCIDQMRDQARRDAVSLAAARQASEFTWAKFRRQVVDEVESLLA